MFHHILVPVDGSAPSRRAFRLAARLAREQKPKARLTALWIAPAWEPGLYAYGGSLPAGMLSPRAHAERARRAAGRVLAFTRPLACAAGVSCRAAHREGVFPHLEILRASRRDGCDLIVMGSHGRRGIARLLLGSQASLVLAHSRRPVLIVR